MLGKVGAYCNTLICAGQESVVDEETLLNIPVVIGIGAGVFATWREDFRYAWEWCRTKMEGGMSQRTFSFVAGVVFGLIALGHVLRIVLGWSLTIQDFSVPMWASWIAIVVMAYLAYQAFRLARKPVSGV
jgi:hypothetical protein